LRQEKKIATSATVMNQDGVSRALMMKFGLLLVALGLCGLPGFGTTSQHPAPPVATQPAAAMESKATAGQQPAGASLLCRAPRFC